MKHIQTATRNVSQAAMSDIGMYMILAGQIIGIMATLFYGKEIFGPPPTAEDEDE